MRKLHQLVEKATQENAFNFIFRMPFIARIPAQPVAENEFSSLKAVEEMHILAQAAIVLLVHKMSIEQQMMIYLGHRDIIAVRRSLRDVHKDEQTFLNSLRKSTLKFDAYQQMLGRNKSSSEQKETSMTLQEKLDNPLYELEQREPRLQEMGLQTAAAHIALGQSYHRVEKYCRAVNQQLEVITPLLKEDIIQFNLEAKELSTQFETYCTKAVVAFRKKEYLTAFMFYLRAIFFIMKSKFSPVFDFNHEKWGHSFRILAINVAKICFYIENDQTPSDQPIHMYKPFLDAVTCSAIIRRDKADMVKLLNWERKQNLYRFFKSFNTLDRDTVTTIADYANDKRSAFEFPSKAAGL